MIIKQIYRLNRKFKIQSSKRVNNSKIETGIEKVEIANRTMTVPPWSIHFLLGAKGFKEGNLYTSKSSGILIY